MRRRFFVEKFDAGRAELFGETAEHLRRVLRAEVGQLYELSDGKEVWLGCVERISRSRGGDAIEFALTEKIPTHQSPLRIKLLLSIVKFDRMEWCLEKAAELGADEIVPLAASRSEKALVMAAAKRSQRWRKILLESAQQSRRLRPPILADVMKGSEAFAAAKGKIKIMLSERAEVPSLCEVLRNASGEAVCVAIGSEGGWTAEEFAAARRNGFHEASLGREILRTETAVIAALAIIRYIFEGKAPQ